MRINAVDPSNLFPPTAVAPSTYRKMCAGDNRGRRESPEERVREEREEGRRSGRKREKRERERRRAGKERGKKRVAYGKGAERGRGRREGPGGFGNAGAFE